MVSLRSKPSVLAERDVHASELLPQLFLAYDQEYVPNNILDVGAGGSHTIDAFAFYKSRVHFLDLYSLELPEQGSDNRQQAYAQHAFSDLFGDSHGVKFDLCLLWDLPLVLSPPALRGLSAALAPYLGDQSQGYVAGQQFYEAADQAWRYRIQDAQHLARLPAKSGTGSSQDAWSQRQFEKNFSCLQIVADRLYASGRLELLMGIAS